MPYFHAIPVILLAAILFVGWIASYAWSDMAGGAWARRVERAIPVVLFVAGVAMAGQAGRELWRGHREHAWQLTYPMLYLAAGWLEVRFRHRRMRRRRPGVATGGDPAPS